jgi:hypothetical protein
LNDKENAGEYNTKQESNDEIPYSHTDSDSPDGNILGPINSMSGIPDRLNRQVESEHKYQGANDHDR